MSAPAGWHLQPDGRERYWDGSRWTDQFRMPAPTEPMDPTAPPPAPSWAPTVGETPAVDATPGVDETQALDVSGTQVLPQAPSSPPHPDALGGPPVYRGADSSAAGTAAPAPYPTQQQYGYPSAAEGLPPAPYGAPGGYGTPGGQWQAPPPSGSSGVAKGCLIAALAVLLVVGIAVVAAIFFLSRAAEEVVDTIPSIIPTEVPSGIPTDLPSDIPTEGLGERIELAVGEGFELPRAVVEDGWRLQARGGAVPIVNVTGMRATLEDDDGFPVLFTMAVAADGGDRVETVCTAPAGSAGATVDVSCVPLFGDVADATRVTITSSL